MNYETVINAALEKHLASNPRITTADLYEKVKDQLEPPLELAEFRVWVGKFIASHAKYESSKGRYGGIRFRSDDNPPRERMSEPKDTNEPTDESSDDSEDSDDGEGEGLATIMLNSTTRIHATDKRNWAVQKKVSDDVWLSKWYYPSLKECFQGCARKILDGTLRMNLGKVSDLNELAGMIQSLEGQLQEVVEAFEA